MAPKTTPQKTVDYENDSFEVWLQKTNVISAEQGDLNTLHPGIYSPNPNTPDFKPIAGLAYAELAPLYDPTLDAFKGPAPVKLFGLNTQFTKQLHVGDLIGLDLNPPEPPPINVHPYPTDLYRWVLSTSAQTNQCRVFRETGLRSPVGLTPLRMHVLGNEPQILTHNTPVFNLALTTLDDVWKVSVYVRANQLSSCKLLAFEVDANGQRHAQGGAYATSFDVTTEWQLISINVPVTNPNSKYIQVRLDGPTGNNLGHILWFDGLDVKKVVNNQNFFPYPNNIGFWARNALNNNATLAIDANTTSPVGTTPLKLTATDDNAALGTFENEKVEYSVAPINYGETWVCSVLVKAQTPNTKARLFVATADSSHMTNSSIVEMVEEEITEDWQKISLEITITDPTAAFLRLSLGAESSGNIFWFDDLRVLPKQADLEHTWNNKSTYLLKVTDIINDNEIVVEADYAGPTPYPEFPTTSSVAKPIFVKQVNLVDSINTLYNSAVLGLRRILIRSIGMS